jgi:hypothetical protein
MTEAEFDVFPPGLRGLNRLAMRLNALMEGKQISDWHPGRWSDRSHTKHGVLFNAVLAGVNRDEARGHVGD